MFELCRHSNASGRLAYFVLLGRQEKSAAGYIAEYIIGKISNIYVQGFYHILAVGHGGVAATVSMLCLLRVPSCINFHSDIC